MERQPKTSHAVLGDMKPAQVELVSVVTKFNLNEEESRSIGQFTAVKPGGYLAQTSHHPRPMSPRHCKWGTPLQHNLNTTMPIIEMNMDRNTALELIRLKCENRKLADKLDRATKDALFWKKMHDHSSKRMRMLLEIRERRNELEVNA